MAHGNRTDGVASAAEPVVKTMSVVFTDMIDSTRIVDDLGDERWFSVVAWHHEQADRLASLLGAKQVTSTGDGVVAVFEEPAAAVAFGFEMVRFIEHGLGPTAGLDLRLRAGVATGEVHAWHANHYGRTMHLAARLTNSARGGEVLLDEASAAAIAGSAEGACGGVECEGKLSLRGFAKAQQTYSLRHQPEAWRLGDLRHPSLATD